MQKKFKFSVIIPVYNVEDYIEETLQSVIDQTIGFIDNIQIILINDGSTDNSEEICLKYQEMYPDNIIYYKQKNAGVSVARNKGIELAEGEFTNFLDSDDLWSADAFEEMYRNYLENKDITLFSCRMRFFDAKKGNHPLNYKYKENKVVDILEDYAYPQLSSSDIFIKTSVLKKYRYEKGIKYAEDNKLINEIIFDEQKIMMLKQPIYYYRKRATGTSALQSQNMDLDWYLVTPQKVFKHLYDLSKKKFGRVIEYIQYITCYDISWRLAFNKKFEMTPQDREKYASLLTDLIKEMDDDIILHNRLLSLTSKAFLFETKGNNKIRDEIVYEDDHIRLRDIQVRKKNLEHLIIDQIYFIKGQLRLFGRLNRKFVPQKDFNIKNGDKEVKVNYYELTNNYNIEAFNGKNISDYIGINVEIDIKDLEALKFYCQDEYLVPRFKRNSIFTEALVISYHHVDKKTTIIVRDNALVKQKRNVFKSFYYELKNEIYLYKKKRYKALLARFITKMARLFKRKELWFISDRVNKADDNGEHFFKYMVENHPEKNVYFVLTSDSPDYERLSKIGKVIDPNSNKYKLMFHRADYVVSAHAENYIYNPFGKGGKYLQDQYQFKYIFLQHGITKDNLSAWINVNTKKMNMFVSACIPEYQSLLDYKYYFGPDIVKLTGFPRFDGLYEKKKKYKLKNKIMLSLTWRASLASNVDKKTGQRLYNEEFKNSDYFKFLNNLMNDKRLLKVLKEKDYKIRFIPHPNVLCQLEDFQKNEFVEIAENSINYQKEFCENKVLVTDYSSVFFDFAYLKKPLLYYQPDREEFFAGQVYDEGYFDYNEMGFGPVHDNYDKFVDDLIKIINNDCIIEEKYEKRIDEFFKFHDNKNCQRVYEEIINLDKK